jgi:hypothetical protein
MSALAKTRAQVFPRIGHVTDLHVTDSRTNSSALPYSSELLHSRYQCKDKLFAQLIPYQSSLTNSSHISLLQAKLPPGANRILFVKNLNYQITGDDLYDLFGRYGSIRQIRIGNEAKTKGTAFVVFDDVMDVRSVLSFLPPPSPM